MHLKHARRSHKQTWKWKRRLKQHEQRATSDWRKRDSCMYSVLLMDPQNETSPVRHAPSLQLSAMHAARYSYPGQPQAAGHMLRTRYLRALELVAGH